MLLTFVKLVRFNAAVGIGSAGFSEGMVCVPPDRPAAKRSRLEVALRGVPRKSSSARTAVHLVVRTGVPPT